MKVFKDLLMNEEARRMVNLVQQELEEQDNTHIGEIRVEIN